MKTRILLLIAGALVACGTVIRAADGASKGGKKSNGPDLFAEPKVHDVRIDLSEAAVESLRKDPKRYVKANVQCGGQTFADTGLRLKGSAAFEGLEKRPGLMLKFDEFVKDQEWQGRGRVLLNSARQDPTFLCEALGGELFRASGVPAAKVTYATVRAGGKPIGLYVVAEAANKSFLSQHFKKTKGNLYEGSKNDITDKLEKDGGDDSAEQVDLRALAETLKEPDMDARWRRATPLLDLERFAAFAAVEVLTGHHDGYTMDRNNYRLYNDPASGQFVFLPHDLDKLFPKADEPLFPEWKGLVAKSILSLPAGRKLYLKQMAALMSGAFKPETMQQRITELAAIIRPALSAGDSTALKAFDDSVAQLKAAVAARHAFLVAQLKSTAAKE